MFTAGLNLSENIKNLQALTPAPFKRSAQEEKYYETFRYLLSLCNVNTWEIESSILPCNLLVDSFCTNGVPMFTSMECFAFHPTTPQGVLPVSPAAYPDDQLLTRGEHLITVAEVIGPPPPPF
eukprot:GHVT01056647.1.p1 GENE.GHVT01056647.1~~GHVT01056647.1.p1  ORF type:complete len:123 (+),score=4.73 GHVT01056647.1:80-448(+)